MGDVFGHELLLLMLSLSRVRDRERVLQLFVEALSQALPGVKVCRLPDGEEGAGEVVEVATPEERFGRLLVVDPAGALSDQDRGRLRSAINMLAVVLENISRAEQLANENAHLDAAVAQRTAELRLLAGELEDRVAERTRQLTAANKELDAFAYSVSHDLRAPLRHVDGYAELLRQDLGEGLSARARYHLDTLSAEVRRMSNLIDDVLAFSRTARVRLAVQPVELGPLVHEVAARLAVEAGDRDVRWSVAKLPAVGGDPAMLRVAFTNLLSNALKFTRPRPRAEIEVGSRSDGDDAVVVHIRDNGVGFDPRHAGKLFTAFERLHRSDEFEGSGIGLATVRRVVERHGGRIWAESILGEGATFFLRLPLRPAAAALGKASA